MTRTSFLPSFWLTCASVMPAWAFAQDRIEPAPHPLLSEEARALGAGQLSRSEAEKLLVKLQISEWSEEGADGSERRGTRVTLRDLEPLHETPVQRIPDPGVIVHPQLRAQIESGRLREGLTPIAIGLRTEGTAVRGTWGQERMIGYLTGDIRTVEDEDHARLAWVAERQAAGKQLIDWFLAAAEGLEVVERNDFSATLVVQADGARTSALARHPAVRHLGVRAEDRQDDAGRAYFVGGPLVDGYERMDVIQSWPLYNAGYYGAGAGTIGMHDGEDGIVRRNHPGFDNHLGADRVENCVGTGLTCTSNPAYDLDAKHTTMVASVLVGDISRGQDTNFVCGSPISRACHERSGVARRAALMAVAGSNSRALDVALDRGFPIFSRTISSANDDPNCTGSTAYVRDWNGLYEAGTAFFQSSGNLLSSLGETDDPADCKAGSPSTGLGAFSVSAFVVNSSHNEVISGGTRRGGTTGQGAPRSIIAAAGITDMFYSYQYDPSAGDYVNPSLGWQGGTSSSTPLVAGIAAVYRDWYLTSGFGSLVNDPAVLYTNLLLMGDQTGQSGSLTSGFDNLWGAGKLRLRTFDPAGLDGPARFATGSTCVSHGATVSVGLTPDGALDAVVDIVRVVAWWYQENHDDGTEAVNDIDLRLQRKQTTFPYAWTTIRSSTANDHKQQVTYFNPSPWEMRFQLVGNTVATDDEGCGTNGVRVYYAALWEDNARDDDATLQTYVRPW